MIPEIIIGIVGSAALLYISRAALRRPGAHGFYRFFAWEGLLILFLLNARRWFVQPLALHQVISWGLLLISLALVLSGLSLLRRRGQPDPQRADEALLPLEKTTALVTTGIYRYIRHPLYSSLLFLGWGIFFKQPAGWGAALALGVSVFLTLTARAEEQENIRYFGAAYQAYRQHTKMFVPFIF